MIFSIRFLLLLIFTISLTSKLINLKEFRSKVDAMLGGGARYSSIVVTMVLLLESTVVLLLNSDSSARQGACAAFVALLLYTCVVINETRKSKQYQGCACFGFQALGSRRSAKFDLIRNSLLLTLAGVPAFWGAATDFAAPPFIHSYLADHYHVLVTLLCGVTVCCFLVLYDKYALLERNLVTALEKVERAANRLFAKRLPSVAITDINDKEASLLDAIHSQKKTVILFVIKGCTQCGSVLSKVIGDSALTPNLNVLILVIHDRDYAKELEQNFKFSNIIVDRNRAAMELFELGGFPAAVCINEQKYVFSFVATGESQILSLLNHVRLSPQSPWLNKK